MAFLLATVALAPAASVGVPIPDDTLVPPRAPVAQEATCATVDQRVATETVLIPNVHKGFSVNLGGGSWSTTFVVQNVGTADTTLEVTYLRFVDSQCVLRLVVSGLPANASFAQVPANDHRLPNNIQYSAVVRSFGASIAAISNMHSGGFPGASEALSWAGASAGATTVVLPNVVRRFFGYSSGLLIQNHGQTETLATVRFIAFDGTPGPTVTRSIPAGETRTVTANSDDPNGGVPGLADGKQYRVNVTSPHPISVVVNTHDRTPGPFNPMAYSSNGISVGASPVYGPYAAKNSPGTPRVSTIVVQNMETAPIRPTLTFTPLGGGPEQAFTAPSAIGPEQAWAFDPRFTIGTTTPCTGASATCLGDGEYSFVARSGGATNIAAVVNVIGRNSALGYTALTSGGSTLYLPNVTHTLGGANGWTTPILLQSLDATGANLRWYRFGERTPVHTHSVSVPRGAAVRVDPRDVPQLSADTQYSVVVDAMGGVLTAIVMQLAGAGGDGMFYEAFVR